jgi:hypothetical protein
MGSVGTIAGLRSVRTVDVSKLKHLLSYDPLTGGFTWRVSKGRAKQGSTAGALKRRGYVDITLDGQRFAAHRLAWLYSHGVWPTYSVDHINGNPSDNRLKNLRDVPHISNMQNERSARASNSHGFLGATWCKDKCKWAAQIRHQGKKVRIGLYDTPQDAHNAYVETKRRLHAGCTI